MGRVPTSWKEGSDPILHLPCLVLGRKHLVLRVHRQQDQGLERLQNAVSWLFIFLDTQHTRTHAALLQVGGGCQLRIQTKGKKNEIVITRKNCNKSIRSSYC